MNKPMSKIIFLISFYFVIGFFNAFGQTYPADVYYDGGSRRSTGEIETRKKLYDAGRANDRIAQMRADRSFNNSSNSSRLKLSKEDREIITPSDTDKNKYRQILDLPKTRMIKLLDSQCFRIVENDKPVELSKECKTAIPGFGAFYSFRAEQHSYRAYSDIQFFKDWFISSGLLTQGIIVSLGETDFEKVSLSSNGVKFLTEFIPAETAVEADKQKSTIENGIEKGKFYYNRAVEVKENGVYAMRSVAYRSKIKMGDDKRKDVIIVFKVIRKSPDGNITLIWRELQNKEAPEIKG